MQFFFIIDHVALIKQCFLKVTPQNNEKINFKIGEPYPAPFIISSGSLINKQKSSAL